MIEITGLSKTYKGSGVKAVDDVTFTVENGDIFGFLGPNGAGKSTTIKCLTGIYGYDAGNIKICGVDMKEHPIEAKRHIGYVPDEHITYEGLKGAEYVNFIADIFGVPQDERRERTEKLAALFGLSDRLNDSISSYSHGMKQKLSVIASLVHDPDVWILDEPMTGLDPQSAYNLKQLMAEHAAKGKVVFFSSHVLDVVEKVCTKVAVIDKGRLLTVSSIEDLKNKDGDESLEEFFLTLTKQAEAEYVEPAPIAPQPKKRGLFGGLFGKKDDGLL